MNTKNIDITDEQALFTEDKLPTIEEAEHLKNSVSDASVFTPSISDLKDATGQVVIDSFKELFEREKTFDVPTVEQCTTNDPLETDFNYTREIAQMVIAQGAIALNELSILGKVSNQIKPYETMTKLISAITKASKDLLDLHGQKQRVRLVEDPEDRPNVKVKEHGNIGAITVNNTSNNTIVFSGTTADFMKAIRQSKIQAQIINDVADTVRNESIDDDI